MHLIADTNLNLTLLNTGLTALVGIGLGVINRRAQAREHENIKRDQKIDTLETKLDGATQTTHELAAKLVDERFRAMTHEVNNHMQGFLSTLDEMKGRLRDGEAEFGQMRDGGHELKLEIAKGLAEIKQVISERAASKQDMRDHQASMQAEVKSIQSHLGQQDIKQATQTERVDNLASRVESLMNHSLVKALSDRGGKPSAH
jgi:predicted nuclease with TOPRIM domain